MTAPLDAARQHIAGAIDQTGDLFARVKAAKDTAFVIGAQAQMEGAQRDFHAWTTENPDTSKWDDELASRTKAVTDQITGDAKDHSVSSMATLQLTADIGAWQTRTKAFAGQLKTEQDIKNASGVGQLAITAAIANNDPVGATSVIDTLQHQGVFSAPHAAALKKSVTVGIATNVATSDIEGDPFTAVDKLTAKGEDGSHLNYPGLPEVSRVNLMVKANKIAAETRSNTLRTWAGMVEQANTSGSPLPDRDGLMQEAERQGIKPAQVDAILRPSTFKPDVVADLSSRILSPKYNPFADPHAEVTRANFESEIYAAHLPTPTRDRLLKALTDKNEPGHVYNSPVFKEAMQTNDFNFSHEVYGKYETRVRNVKTGEYSTVINQAALARAKATQAKVTDALTDYVERHPVGTPGSSQKEIGEYIKTVYSGATAHAGAALFKFNP